jgi:hypothetical protein
MDTGIIFAIVLAILFLGGIAWLVIYSNRRVPGRTFNRQVSKCRSLQNRSGRPDTVKSLSLIIRLFGRNSSESEESRGVNRRLNLLAIALAPVLRRVSGLHGFNCAINGVFV